MPQRFLRPGITNSERWNQCSFEAQSLWLRLLTLVDDFGRYDGRIPILRGHCFALRPDINPQQTAAFRSELHANGLIEIYEVDGKEYVQMLRWQERARVAKSKWPDPGSAPQETAADGSAPQETAADGSAPQETAASLASISSPSPSPSPSPAPIRQPLAAVSANNRISNPELAKCLICEKILGGQDPGQPWSYLAQRRLSDLCGAAGGIPLQQIEDIAAYRSIEKSDDIPELKLRRDNITETVLMEYWGDEVSRAQYYLKKYRASRNGSAKPQKPEPARWVEFFRWKYGPECELPPAFWLLPDDQKKEWERDHHAFEAKNPITT